MKLIQASASPFARKARILILELQLQDKISEENPGPVTPVSNNEDVNKVNPLGLIPVLQLDDGSSLYDSNVICEYLDAIGGNRFIPTDQEARFRSLKLQALADGMMDIAVALRYETALRPIEYQWPDWIKNQFEKVTRALDSLEQQSDSFNADPTIGEIAAVCALGYQDFRFADNNWRDGRNCLSEWYERMLQRPSIANTMPS